MDRNRQMRAKSPHLHRGFTLIEMIVVIVLTSIIASVVAMFIRLPVQGYVDTARRAELTDTADTAIRRMGRDLRLALPNSVRVNSVGSTVYLELLETRTGGRYRAEQDCSGACIGNILDFTFADADGFDVLGSLSPVPVAGDLVAVYNLGIPAADAYNGDNTQVITSATATSITWTTGKQFPFASPGNRFQVVEGPVTYVCAPGARDAQGNATGTLTRVWNYTVRLAIPDGTYSGSPISALAANNVENCDFAYNPGVTARLGLVTLTLQLTQASETVQLYHEVHVTNVP